VGGTADVATWNLALDEPGGASRATVVRSALAAALLVVAGFGVAAFGSVQLAKFPTFTAAHGSWVFVVDATTAWVLLIQFWSVRRPVYAVLGSAYLTDALLMPVFVLTFPDGVRQGDTLVGGSQSSIWVWHTWHLLFAVTVLVALVGDRWWRRAEVRADRVVLVLAAASGAALAQAGMVTLAVTVLHDGLPVLIVPSRADPLTSRFYVVAVLLVVLTALAAGVCWADGLRRRSALHLWLAVALTAFLADAVANLFSNSRFTVGWYFGRIDSVVASSVLLMVFLGETGRLFRRLVVASAALARTNAGLVTAAEEKDALVIDLRRSEEQVRQLAFYDDLTGLPNRRLLTDRAEQAVAHANRHGGSVAVLFLDLDDFKEINDTLGHDVGDTVLTEVASRLVRCSRRGDTVSRVGGDEFVVLLAEVTHARDAGRVAEKVLHAMTEPLVIGPHRLDVTTSIGIALHPEDEPDDLAALLKDADVAMYAAKAAGRNLYRFYSDLPLAVHRRVRS
jgi:diguanylate cyclase (GGDEF)-like protein